ncbi:hypothetical protein RI543_003865 [Arxiozyma heterogenica]|uniref:Uncharacterized protein n=1 Tax=Arxiozyma heterogenica TaxID=278026 RepID=A0AAN8A6M0_9SACH|nr:hypothetical protein RI543_003865 [Kazachstania heterogenica]
MSNAIPVASIVSTTTGPTFTNSENQPISRNSKTSTTIVDSTESSRPETLLTTMVPKVSQYVSEQLFSSSTAVTVSHGGIPSLASYEGEGSTIDPYTLKYSQALYMDFYDSLA